MRELNNLGDLIDRSLDLDRLAVIDLRDPQAPREYTHRDIDELAGGVAHWLVARGLARGARVAILALNRTEYIATYFGIMRAGFVAVPVNTKLAADAIAYVLQDASVELAFVDAARCAVVPAGMPRVDFDDAGPEGFAARIRPAPFETVVPAEGEVAQILYTSGSTGRPKGVPLSHAGQLWALCAKPLAPGAENERQIVAQPLFHMNGLMTTKGVFRAGASMVVMPGFDTRAYTEALSRHRVTTVTAVPTMFARVIKELEGRDDLDLSHLKRIALASAPITATMLERIGRAIPSAQLGVGYGTTEAGPSPFTAHPDGRPAPPLALGVAFPGSELKLVDGPDENEGVLMMRNPSVMTGYLNLPEKSAQVLRDGWYYSGDVMRRDADGFYYFIGRADDMFVCSGENIYPGEVEKLLERHPGIQQAVVVPLPDEERSHVPVAFVIRRAGAEPSVEEIKRFAIENGPAYQHPRRIRFLADMPWAGTNKIDRNALVTRARELEAANDWSR
jgi:long-chain acyl-CoA synthetase